MEDLDPAAALEFVRALADGFRVDPEVAKRAQEALGALLAALPVRRRA